MSTTLLRVVLCDGDYGVLRALGDALRVAGHRVVLAVDGRSGLARAVETSPDVIVVDREIAIVELRTFLELVRENPRTASAYVIVTGHGDPRRVPLDARMQAMAKPLDVDEVVRRIVEVGRFGEPPAQHTEPSDASAVAALARADGPAELTHSLGEVRLSDIVQIFALRRRTGRIEVGDPRGRGEIMLHEGRITAARHGGVSGRRAAVWALAAARGEMRFVPNGDAAFGHDPDLEGDPAVLLEQAARLSQRLEALPIELRSLDALIALGDVSAGAPGHPIARLLLALLGERPLTLRETIDRLGADEATSLSTVGAMVSEGRVVVLPPTPEAPRVPLVPSEGLDAVASRLASLARPWVVGPPRLLLLAAARIDVEAAVSGLRGIDGFSDRTASLVDLGAGAHGIAGELEVVEGGSLELFVLPLEPSLRPLWVMASSPAVAALVLASSARPPAPDTTESLERLTGLFVRESRDDWHEPKRLAALVMELIGGS